MVQKGEKKDIGRGSREGKFGFEWAGCLGPHDWTGDD